MVSHADSEMAVIKEVVDTHRSLEAGGTRLYAGPHGGAPGNQEAEGVKEKCGEESLTWFSWEGTGETG